MHALFNQNLSEARGTLVHLAEQACVTKLVKAGCDASRLLNTVAYSKRASLYYPDVNTRSMRQLGVNITALIANIKKFIPVEAPRYVGLGPGEDDSGNAAQFDASSYHLELAPLFNGVPELLEGLSGLNLLTDELALASAAKQILRDSQFKQMTYALPALYVHDATESWHYLEVSELYRLADWPQDPEHIRRALRNADAQDPEMRHWMNSALDFWTLFDLPEWPGTRPVWPVKDVWPEAK